MREDGEDNRGREEEKEEEVSVEKTEKTTEEMKRR